MSSNSLRPHKVKDLTGRRFGRLVAVSQVDPVLLGQLPKHRRAVWWCQCDCGKQLTVRSNDLLAGILPTRSCGCLRGRPKKGETLRDAYQRRGLQLPEGNQ